MNVSSDLLDLNSKSPAFSIVIEGKDVTATQDPRLMSLTLTDNRGFEADQLDLELDDADGQIVLPRRGAVIQLALGKYLTDKALDHLDKTNERDASFLMKLAREYGAVASVKNGNLLFIR